MHSAVSFLTLMAVLAIAAAFGGESGGFDGLGEHHHGGDEGGFGGGDLGGFGGAAGGQLGGGHHHDLKGFAYSYVNVYRPKTFTVPIYKYVYQPHHKEESGEENLGAGYSDGGFGDFGGFNAAQNHHHF